MAITIEPRCEVLLDALARLRANRAQLDELLDGADVEALARRPAPDGWSAVECLEHLRVTAALYRPRLEGAIGRGRERGFEGRAPYGRGTWVGRLLLGVLDPARDEPKAVKAPGTFRPSPSSELKPALVAEGLRKENEHLQALVREADGLDLGRLRLGTPISPLLRLTVDQAFRVLAVHEARHLAQAARALTATGAGA